MAKCNICGREIADEEAWKLTFRGKTHYFDTEEHLHQFHPVNTLSRILSSVVLSKTFTELLAIGTGLGGILYTVLDLPDRALVFDTLSTIAAIAALVIGVEHLRYLREHRLLRRAVLLIGIGILITIAIMVWIFGLNQI
jgi:YHS domain-containing protein